MVASVILSGIEPTKDCLKGIFEQDYPNCELVQVDGRGLSQALATNLAVSKARDGNLIFTDCDTILPKNTVSKLMKYKGIVSGRRWNCGNWITETWNHPVLFGKHSLSIEGEGFTMACAKIPKEDYPGLNSPVHMDLEFLTKVNKPILIDPSIKVLHVHPIDSEKKLFTRSRDYTINHFAFPHSRLSVAVSAFLLLFEFSLIPSVLVWLESKREIGLFKFVKTRILYMIAGRIAALLSEKKIVNGRALL